MRHLDLFSGIGGFALAARNVGWQTVAFCELEPFCRAVLHRHWPEALIYDDVRELTADRLAADGAGGIDVITGGFPCQDISWAGPGDGIGGERSGLWGEYARLVGELRPRFVVVENVAALLARGMGVVIGDLARIGYDAEWSVVSACSVGAPHVRRRVFIVAYPNGEHGRPWVRDTAARPDWPLQALDSFEDSRARWRARLENPSALYGGAYGVSNGMDRNRAYGNAIVPQIAETIFRSIAQSSGDSGG